MTGNNRKKLIKCLMDSAVQELELLSYSDSEGEEIIDELEDNLAIVASLRYSSYNTVPKNSYYNTLNNLDEDRFKVMARVTREQFNIILSLIEENKVFKTQNCEKQFSVSFQLALVLYRLGSSGEGATVGKIAALFGVGDGGTIQRITDRVFRSILDLQKIFIKWPNNEERNEIIAENVDELSYCVGYIDGTEIPLAEAPTLDHYSYFSRCKQYSLKVQAICDPNYRVTHVMVGYPGSAHDARIFANSGIGKNPAKFLSGEQWLAEDSAYKLTRHVITPFRRNSKEETYEIRKKFNKKFCKYRVRIEHCFGYIKEKFNSLKELRVKICDTKSHESACTWIRVCFILYNIILPHIQNEIQLFASSYVEQDESEHILYRENDEDGTLKRKALLQLILN